MSASVDSPVSVRGVASVSRRPLGRSGLMIPQIAFGAGPVSGLMTSSEDAGLQRATMERAFSLGIDWVDTAAAYGAGRSEENLGRLLGELDPGGLVRVATKVRLRADQLGRIPSAIRESVQGSLGRLRGRPICLLQLHNGITRRRGEWPDSLTPDDVLGGGGVLSAFEDLRREGVVAHLGLTGQGDLASLTEVMAGGAWASIQVNEHALIRRAPGPGNLPEQAAARGLGVLAIRVMAGGALAGREPSAHTLRTPFFPLSVYERDRENARRVAARLGPAWSLPELAVRHVLGQPRVASAILGFSSPAEVEDAVRFAQAGPLPAEVRAALGEITLPEETP